MAYTQTNRRIAITTPLGDDVLLLRGFTGSESISQLFHFDLDLLSENDSLKFQDIVGKNVTVRIMDVKGKERYWNGFISRFSQGQLDGQFTAYRAQMVPWLWFLTRTADCRIFQSMKAPDIIQKIFSDLKFQDFKLSLYGSFVKRDYCVQYRETDFNFVSRLMEEEGIYYFFDHQKDKHILHLANDPAALSPCPNQATALYQFHGAAVTYDEDVVHEWRHEEEFRTGAWAHTDYNFETPSTSLSVTVNGANPYEIYEFPGEHGVRSDGDSMARIRLQEQTARTIVIEGTGTCRYFSSGYLFTLQDHYRSDQNQQYLLTAVRHAATHDDYSTGSGTGSGGGTEFGYHNSFECIPFSTPFRPARVTPEPFVQGCQTALVVGPGGEEIYTDKYGRVKVQFHWDREGKKNENSSCWVRVSHPWAGQGWGSISIPRIGQEVIVDFLEGDPDRPIIVGRVYNAEQMPPFGMPGGAVVSGVKSNSTKGGGGYNEISLNDTKGTELINIHAQYDQQKKVEHDERVNVGHDRTEEVGHDETIKIDHDKAENVVHDRSLDVGHDKSEKVGRNKKVHVVDNHNENVDGSMYVTVGKTLTETVTVNYAESVGGAMELTVGGALAVSVGAAMAETVGGAKIESVGLLRSVNVGQNNTLNVGKDLTERVSHDRVIEITNDLKETIGGQHQETVTKEYTLHAKKIDIVADEEINIKTGDAQIVMKKSGDITINGGKITVKGSGDIVIKGSTIKEN